MSQQSQYEVVERGTLHTLDYRIFISKRRFYFTQFLIVDFFKCFADQIF